MEKLDLVDHRTTFEPDGDITTQQGGPDMEKGDLVDHRAEARFGRVESYLVARPALFAAQGYSFNQPVWVAWWIGEST